MEELLFLAHRIPYPPNKGCKIRAWHMLKHLATRYSVRLGCLIDDPDDARYVTDLERVCAEVMAVPVKPAWQYTRALLSLRPGAPLSTGYFHAPALAAWVKGAIGRHHIRHAFIYSSPMMDYLPPRAGLRTVLDLVDVDSEKWREMASHARVPKRWIYAREAETLLAFERRAAAAAEYTLLSTEAEARLFVTRAPEAAATTRWILNGVDSDYFSPAHVFPNPFSDARPAIVFTGDMGYWPNVDAVAWFAREVMPRLRSRSPAPRFAIVGAHPTAAVRALAAEDILVTGRVEDVRPYLAHAVAVVAPLQLARGVQNKVLEGMAMGRVVVATDAAEQGLSVAEHGAILLANSPEETALRICETLDGKHDNLKIAARRIAESRFSWAAATRRLDGLLIDAEYLNEDRVA